MVKALFRGSTSHELSQEEEKAFWERLSISGRYFSFGDEAKLRAGIREMFKTPTGREQVRKIIHYEPKDYKFKIDVRRGLYADLKESNVLGGYDLNSDRISVYPHDKDDKDLGQILFHEMMHARQQLDIYTSSSVLADTETQALSMQLSYEGHIQEDRYLDANYNKSYEVNLKKWRQIAQNPHLTPKGMQAFEPIEGLTSEELAQAQEQYACQMASKETRTQYIKDFMKDPASLTSDMPYACLQNRYFKTLYRLQDIGFFNAGLKNPADIQFGSLQQYLKKEYGLEDSDFSRLERFYRTYNRESKANYPDYRTAVSQYTREYVTAEISKAIDGEIRYTPELKQLRALEAQYVENPNDINKEKFNFKSTKYAYHEGKVPLEFYISEQSCVLRFLKGKIPEKEYQSMEKEFFKTIQESQWQQKMSQNNHRSTVTNEAVVERGASANLKVHSRRNITSETTACEQPSSYPIPKPKGRRK